jgi:hypothetical protein
MAVTINRLFQDHKGTLNFLQGKSFSCVKALKDLGDGDVILMWCQDQDTMEWYRMFIDGGAYCGVDLYSQDSSADDLDEGLAFQDVSPWFNGKKVQSASVGKAQRSGEDIVLSLEFGQSMCQLICLSVDGICRLELGENEEHRIRR